jgi:hypothetical protein
MVNSSDNHTLATVGSLEGNVAFLAKWVAST